MQDKTIRADLNVGVNMRLLGQDLVRGGLVVCVACLEPGREGLSSSVRFGDAAMHEKQAVTCRFVLT